MNSLPALQKQYVCLLMPKQGEIYWGHISISTVRMSNCIFQFFLENTRHYFFRKFIKFGWICFTSSRHSTNVVVSSLYVKQIKYKHLTCCGYCRKLHEKMNAIILSQVADIFVAWCSKHEYMWKSSNNTIFTISKFIYWLLWLKWFCFVIFFFICINIKSYCCCSIRKISVSYISACVVKCLLVELAK